MYAYHPTKYGGTSYLISYLYRGPANIYIGSDVLLVIVTTFETEILERGKYQYGSPN
jgi:hypothetical protein